MSVRQTRQRGLSSVHSAPHRGRLRDRYDLTAESPPIGTEFSRESSPCVTKHLMTVSVTWRIEKSSVTETVLPHHTGGLGRS